MEHFSTEWSGFVVGFLSYAPCLVKKIRATLSTNQIKEKVQLRLGNMRFTTDEDFRQKVLVLGH